MQLGAKSNVPQGNGEHIFIVDDEEGLARIFGRLLQNIGYRVTVQTHPAKAVELFEKDPAPYQLAIIDLHMPPPGGARLAKRLHELRPELPIFIMSGYSDALGDTTPEELGVIGILQKPVTRETLATELRKALDRSAAE
jgi:two-component system, cell cycle sensor histidine kinase and response regulator CckA